MVNWRCTGIDISAKQLDMARSGAEELAVCNRVDYREAPTATIGREMLYSCSSHLFSFSSLSLARAARFVDRPSVKCCWRYRQCDYLDFDSYIDPDVPPHKMVFYMYIIPRYAHLHNGLTLHSAKSVG